MQELDTLRTEYMLYEVTDPILDKKETLNFLEVNLNELGYNYRLISYILRGKNNSLFINNFSLGFLLSLNIPIRLDEDLLDEIESLEGKREFVKTYMSMYKVLVKHIDDNNYLPIYKLASYLKTRFNNTELINNGGLVVLKEFFDSELENITSKSIVKRKTSNLKNYKLI